jgi:hypothetical protein
MDSTGRLKVPTQYDEAADFVNGYAIVRLGVLYGVVDSTGRICVAPKYRQIAPLLPDHRGLGACANGAKWGAVRLLDGRQVIPFLYHGMGSFSGGVAPVCQDSLWGFICPEGRMALAPQWERTLPFCEGLAPIRVQGRWTFVNPRGRQLTEPQFDTAGVFSHGLAVVKQFGHWGYLSPDGTMKIDYKFDAAEDFVRTPTGGLFARVRVAQFWAVINPTGNYEVSPLYDDVRIPSEGKVTALKTGTWAVLDNLGLPLGRERFGAPAVFSGGLAATCTPQGKWGFVNAQAQWQIPATYDRTYNFRGAVARVEQGGKLGYIRRDGTFAWPLQ